MKTSPGIQQPVGICKVSAIDCKKLGTESDKDEEGRWSDGLSWKNIEMTTSHPYTPHNAREPKQNLSADFALRS